MSFTTLIFDSNIQLNNLNLSTKPESYAFGRRLYRCQIEQQQYWLKFHLINSHEVLEQALMQAKKGRIHILGKMKESIAVSRPELKPHTPRAFTIVIDKEFIGAVIGPGGKIVQEIQRESGATITIEEKEGKGEP